MRQENAIAEGVPVLQDFLEGHGALQTRIARVETAKEIGGGQVPLLAVKVSVHRGNINHNFFILKIML